MFSTLRESGKTLKHSGGALLDALIAATTARTGSLLVTLNVRDFTSLREHLPFHFESWTDFQKRL